MGEGTKALRHEGTEGEEGAQAVIELAPLQETSDPALEPPPYVPSCLRASVPHLRLLPSPSENHHRAWGIIAQFFAVLIALGYGYFVFSYYVPAPSRPGIDENAYLVGARNFTQHFSTGYKPANDYEYVGAMWLRTAQGWYYPKYSLGTSVLQAMGAWIGHGRQHAFVISPICSVLAMLGMFYLARAIIGSSFFSLMAMLVLVFNPTMLEYELLPGSHAPAIAFVVWGMFFLIRFAQTGSLWQGIVAGLILGAAVTIRYTEALLLFPLYPITDILADADFAGNHRIIWCIITVARMLPIGPIGLVVMLMVKWKSPRTYLRAGVPILAWALPVGIMLLFNYRTLGHLTGYDLTHESSGFTSKEFLQKWGFTVHQLYVYGLFLIAPLGFAGLIAFYQRSWKLALVLTMWFLPASLLYTSYYWGDQMPGVAYLRFFITVFPPVIVGAFYLLHSTEKGGRSIAIPIAGGVITALTVAVSFIGGIPNLERQQRGNLNLQYSQQQLTYELHHAKTNKSARPMLFVDEGMFPQLLQYEQFMSDVECYAADCFEPRGGGGFGLLGMADAKKKTSNTPALVQPERIEYMESVRGKDTSAQLVAKQMKIIGEAVDANRPVYAALTSAWERVYQSRFKNSGFELVKRTKWAEPCAVKVADESDSPRGGPGSRENDLVPRVVMMEPFVHWQPQTMTFFEIKRKPASTGVSK